ncbi:hypothetical protein Poly24_54990 [Rosistilla carotiformis]|uniref:Uncharacterized protein n=1 Tax=Rosistilla carotiformis TaxID=2528017 RepID=A0A518K1W3_9BACT|nr:hypothetical protein [Rosistilla carotiformis]QDV71759.1 hypothetical protein Poly24_54990 [Rosistilla carotiformis]
MTPKQLSSDITDALHAAGDQPLPVVDPSNQKVYFLIDEQTHRRAMAALQQQNAIASIDRGIEGEGMTLEESQRRNLQALQRQQ